jgi:hypothetical protein
LFWIAALVCARIHVVTNDGIVINLSCFKIAPVNCAFIVIVDIDRSEYAFACFERTNISCARILVIADDRSSYNTSARIAGDTFAKVISDKRNGVVSASNFNIAGVFCASIMIVTINWSMRTSRRLFA